MGPAFRQGKRASVAWIMSLLALALIAGIGWPAQLGGSTVYMVTTGNSMEPVFHEGDFVIARHADTYKIGDIAAYYSQDLHRVVLHRVAGMQGDNYVMQGDNNSYTDANPVAAKDMQGRYTMHLPFGTKWRLLSGALILIGLGAIILRSKSDEENERHFMHETTEFPFALTREMVTGVAKAVAIVAAFAAIVVSQLPAHAPKDVEKPTGTAELAYSAQAASGSTYPQGLAGSGDPIYTKLASSVQFTYIYHAPRQSQLTGASGKMVAEISDANGFHREFTLSAKQKLSVEGEGVKMQGDLDLAKLQGVLDEVQIETGLRSDTYTIKIHPHLDLRAQLAGKATSVAHDHSYSFLLSPGLMRTKVPMIIQHQWSADTGAAQVVTVLGLELSRTLMYLALFLIIAAAIAALAFAQLRLPTDAEYASNWDDDDDQMPPTLDDPLSLEHHLAMGSSDETYLGDPR